MPRWLTKAEVAAEEEAIRREAVMDADYGRLEVRIRRGTTIGGAIVALCPAEDGTIVADVCIDGPPVP
jgi:hypothetical protein